MFDEGMLTRVVEFHGHLCRGLATGLRLAEIAMRELGADHSGDEELVAIAENESCAVDALQVVSGCTAGKGNLFLSDQGKQAFTLGRRDSSEAVRVVLRPEARQVAGPEITPRQFLELPEEGLFKVERLHDFAFPERARVFASVVCASCGEGVMEPRARVKDGKIVCLACAGEYASRWQR